MEVFWTVVTGVLVFVASQLFLKLILEPIAGQKRAIGRIAYLLIYHADVYSNPGSINPELVAESRRTFARPASDLQATSALIPFYRQCAAIRLVLPHESIDRASRDLIGISNSALSSHREEIGERCRQIEEALGLPPVY